MCQKQQYRDTAPTTKRQRGKNNCGRRLNQRCTKMTKLVLVIQPACLCPTSCATKEDRQMRMTDKDTLHAPKRMLTSIGLRQNGQGHTLIKKHYHWSHRSWSCENNPLHFVSHILPFARAPIVDVVADCVCAFRGALFSSPALDLHPRLTRAHLEAVATS